MKPPRSRRKTVREGHLRVEILCPGCGRGMSLDPQWLVTACEQPATKNSQAAFCAHASCTEFRRRWKIKLFTKRLFSTKLHAVRLD